MSLKKLLIAGAGDFGREVFQWAKHINYKEKRWNFIGFLDDNISALDKYDLKEKMIGTIKSYYPSKDDELICAIGDPMIKKTICNKLVMRNAEFTNIIHPNTIIGENCILGKGVIICPGVIITTDVRVADFVTINCLSTIGHNVIIEKYCTISGHCDIMGHAYLEKGIFVGSGAKILPKVKVYKNAKIGAGSIVINNVKEGTSVFGNPARQIY